MASSLARHWPSSEVLLLGSLLATFTTPALADAPVLSQPPNVGEAKIAATAYHKSGAYERDLAAVAEASRDVSVFISINQYNFNAFPIMAEAANILIAQLASR